MPGDYFGAYGQQLGTPGNLFSWYTNAADVGGALSIDATGGRNGKPAVQVQPSAVGVASVGFTVSPGLQRTTAFAWMTYLQAPTGASATVLTAGGLTGSNPGIQITTGGVLRAFNGGNIDAYSRTLTVGHTYFLMMALDTSAVPYLLKWAVWDETDGVFTDEGFVLGPGTDVPADQVAYRYINNASTSQWGAAGSPGGKMWDFGWSPTWSTWPLPIVETTYVPLAGVGAHNLAGGSFQKTGAAAITGGDATSYQELDEVPTSIADYVAQTAIDTTAFLEYVPTRLSSTLKAYGVKVYSHHNSTGAGSGLYTMEVRGSIKGADTGDVTSGGAKSSVQDVRRALPITVRPDGQPLTMDDVNAMTLRFGYSSDVTPNPSLASAFAELLTDRQVAGAAITVPAPPLLAQVI